MSDSRPSRGSPELSGARGSAAGGPSSAAASAEATPGRVREIPAVEPEEKTEALLKDWKRCIRRRSKEGRMPRWLTTAAVVVVLLAGVAMGRQQADPRTVAIVQGEIGVYCGGGTADFVNNGTDQTIEVEVRRYNTSAGVVIGGRVGFSRFILRTKSLAFLGCHGDGETRSVERWNRYPPGLDGNSS